MLLAHCGVRFLTQGGERCCKAQTGQAIDSGLSQIILHSDVPTAKNTRHESRFAITSFIYRARRPFHPGRLYEEFLDPFFNLIREESEGPDDSEAATLQRQKEATRKQRKRSATLGDLLRSKGFLWIATSHDVLGEYSQAGNVVTLDAAGLWMCARPEVWQGACACAQHAAHMWVLVCMEKVPRQRSWLRRK